AEMNGDLGWHSRSVLEVNEVDAGTRRGGRWASACLRLSQRNSGYSSPHSQQQRTRGNRSWHRNQIILQAVHRKTSPPKTFGNIAAVAWGHRQIVKIIVCHVAKSAMNRGCVLGPIQLVVCDSPTVQRAEVFRRIRGQWEGLPERPCIALHRVKVYASGT